MRGKGITYDTGFIHQGVSTHDPFNPKVVQREMRVIREDLHCTAVRLTGGDPNRLEIAATHAVAAGLEVWFCLAAPRCFAVVEAAPPKRDARLVHTIY